MARQLGIISLIILLLTGCKEKIPGELIFIQPPDRGPFHYPYYLFLPEGDPRGLEQQQPSYLIVEPNNSGFVSDDLEAHAEKAERQASREYYVGNFVAVKLGAPLLVPVFPRPESDWKIYTHALDRDVILQKETPLERLDLQLLAMIGDARERLSKRGITIQDNILMTGFSASGTFVNRFSLIHPDRIAALAAGGVNGLLMLPVSELNGYELNYPLGIHDFESRFGKAFDSVSFHALPQFLYMGENDTNDAVPYEDGYDPEEREIVYETLGEKMMPDRWDRCIKVYRELNINAEFSTYPGTGHENTDDVKQDILEFFRRMTAPPARPE